MKKYDEIQFKGLDWYVIDIDGDNVKLLLKNVIDEERIKKYADDDFMINGNEVRHSDCIRLDDMEKSYIITTILPNFIKDLGIEAEATLLTKEEVDNLPEEIRKCNDWYWTKSRYGYYSDWGGYFAWRVVTSGGVYSDYLTIEFAVRPVLYLKSHLICCDNARQTACNNELDIKKIEFNQAQKQFLLDLGIYEEFDITINTINKLIEKISKGD